MKYRLLLVVTIFAALGQSAASAQGIKPAPRTPRVHPQGLVTLPPCDQSKLIDLLDQFFAAPADPRFAPEYCAPRTCEAQKAAERYTRDAALLQSIDLMRRACRVYYP